MTLPPRTNPVRPPFVLGIGGPSGSGKTTLATAIVRELGGTHFPLDHYYLDMSRLPPAERERQNFDHPDNLDIALLIGHLGELRQGRTIERPEYDFATHSRAPGRTARVESLGPLIVEGILALYDKELRSLYDLAVYVEAPDAVCYARRLARDVKERGRTPESVERQYAATVRPASEAFARPSRRHAQLIVDGTAPSTGRLIAEIRARLGH